MVQLLDDSATVPPDRLRLIALYLLYRDGLVEGDIHKLLAHSQLPDSDSQILFNLEFIGARVTKPVGENKPVTPPLFPPQRPSSANDTDQVNISRFQPAVKSLLEAYIKGALDSTTFPSLTAAGQTDAQENPALQSLRSTKPSWASSSWASGRAGGAAPRQRIIVYLAGGATYSEARACYEVSQQSNRDVFLATSHMLSPGLFIRQVADLTKDRRRLNIPADRPKPRAPTHLFEPEPRPTAHAAKTTPLPMAPAPPTADMGALRLSRPTSNRPPSSSRHESEVAGSDRRRKDKEKEEEKDRKKRHHFFSSKR